MFSTQPTRTKARKQHRCAVCPDPIVSGSVYRKWFCSDDGLGITVKMHEGCFATGELYEDEIEQTFNGDGWDLMEGLRHEDWGVISEYLKNCPKPEQDRIYDLWLRANGLDAPAAGRKTEGGTK